MAVSQEALIRKMKEALSQAEEHMHTNEFAVSIGKLHVLCELVLDDTKQQNNRPQHQTITNEIQRRVEQQQSSPSQVVVEHEKGDSIFDF